MKQLIDLRCYVSVNGEDYCDTSFRNQYRYVDVDIPAETELIIQEWDMAYKVVAENRVRNACVDVTSIKKRPCISIHYASFSRSDRTITKKNFKVLKYKWVCEPVLEHLSFETLMKYLPADQFCEWVKDQGVAVKV